MYCNFSQMQTIPKKDNQTVGTANQKHYTVFHNSAWLNEFKTTLSKFILFLD